MRPKLGAPVSTPLLWEELDESLNPRSLGMEQALARVDSDGDLFAAVLEAPRSLAPARRALAELA